VTSATRAGQLEAARAYADIVRLAGEIGVRVAGTPAEREGAAYLAEQFRQAGLEPREESFPIPVWHEQRVTLRADGRDVPAISPCFGGVTGPDGVTGEVVAVGDPLRDDDLDGVDLAGKIALIDTRNVYFDYPDYLQTDLLVARDVAGVIFAAGEHQQGGLPQAYYNFKRSLHQPTPPSAIVSHADARRLASHAGVATLVVEAEVTWSESVSVLADLPGSDLADQLIIVSAHHDSVWTSPGASDNAGGCAAVAELARVFAAGPQPRRTIRFVHWGGHEVGLWGSETWLGRHVDEVGRIAAVINFDGQGVVDGSDHASLLGSPSWQRLAEATLAATGVPVQVTVGGGGVDSVNFAAVGRNAINFSRWGKVGNHTPQDNLDSIGPEGMESGLRMSAAILAAVADGDALDLTDAPPHEQLRQTQAWCARWGWGIAG
jgi:Iap family predicted aminopeptidase